MRPAGYTLIELLVVMAIMSIMAVVGFVNFKDFSSEQVTVKAIGQIQSLLRLAQSNATSGILCSAPQAAKLWYLVITSTNVDLSCDTATTVNAYHRGYPTDNVTISVKCSTGDTSGITLPVTISYFPLSGQISFKGSDSSTVCSNTNSLFITATNTQNISLTKSLTISKGGAIDVQ